MRTGTEEGWEKSWVQEQIRTFKSAIQNPAKNKNINLKPRLELLEKP